MAEQENPSQNPQVQGSNLTDSEWERLSQVTVKDVQDSQRLASDEIRQFIEADATG
jgi:hypothetical protein